MVSTFIRMLMCGSVGVYLMGCTTSLPVPQALDYQSISAVEAEIKRQIGLYMVAEARLQPTIIDKDNKPVILSNDYRDYACGGGDVRFDISNVQADLLVTDENIASFGGGITIPTAPLSGGLSGKASRDTTNTQELVYNVWFDPLSKQNPNQDFLTQAATYKMLTPDPANKMPGAPIALSLINLRDSLISAGLKVDPYTHTARGPMPCHWNWNIDPEKPGGDPGNSIKFGITVLKDTSGNGNISIYIVNLSGGDEFKATRANTLTVKFYQHDTLDVDPDPKPEPAMQPKSVKRTSSLQLKTLTQFALNESLPHGVASDVYAYPVLKIADVVRPDQGTNLGSTSCPIPITPRCTIGDTRLSCVKCVISEPGGNNGKSRPGANGLDSVSPAIRAPRM